MALTVGELNVKLAIDLSQFNQQLARIDSQMRQLGSQGSAGFNAIQTGAKGSTAALGGLSIAGASAAVAIGNLAAQGIQALGSAMMGAVNTAASFELQMSAIQAVMQPTAVQFDALSEKARELGATTSFSATEAASGIEMLAKNGVQYDDIMGGVLDSTLSLAAATGTDLALSADIATDVMAAFGMTAADMGNVVNGITGVLTASKFGIDDYRLALANGGAAASAFGVSLDDFNTVIAVTSSQFASGQTAGTAFRTFINRLTPSTQPAIDAMKELGIVTADGTNQFYDSSGALKDMDEVMKILQSTMGDLSEAELASKIETIFGAEAIGTVIGLLNATDEQYKQVQATIANSSAEDQAAERLNNFQGSLTILKSALEGAAIALGSPFLGPLANLVRGVAGSVGTFTQFADSILRAGNPLQALVNAIDTAIPGFAKLAQEAFTWGQNITAQFSAGITSAFGPLVASLRQMGTVIRSWLKPGSPPAITPGLDQWGAEAATVYFEGWAQGDYSAFNQIGSTIESTLRGMIDAGLSAIPPEGVVPTIMGGRSALSEAISQFREFGSVSEDSMQKVISSYGEAGPKVADLISAYFDLESASRAVAEAQEELNSVTEEYNQKLAPLTEEMAALKERQQEIRDMKRIEDLNKKIADEKTSAADRELAQLEIAEIQLRNQIDAVEDEKTAAVDAAQVKLDAAKEQETAAKAAFDAQQSQLQVFNDQNALIAKQTQLLQQMADAAKAAASAASGAGGGGIGGGLAMPGIPEVTPIEPEPETPDRSGVTAAYDANAAAVNNYIQQVQTAQLRERESAPIIQMLSGAFATFRTIIEPLGAVFTGVIVPAIAQVSNIISTATLPLLSRLASVFSETFIGTASGAVTSFSSTITTIQPIITAVIGGVMGTFNGLIGLLTGALPGAGMVVTGLFDSLGATISLFTGIFTGMIDIVANLIAGNWSGAWQAAQTLVLTAFENVKTGVTAALSIVIGVVSTIVGGIVGFFDGAYTSLTGKTSTFSDDVTGFFDTLKENAVNAIQNLFDGAKAIFDTIYSTLTGIAEDMDSDIVKTIEQLKDNAIAAVNLLLTGIKDLAPDFAKGAISLGTELINGIIQGLTNAAGNLYNKVKGIIKGALGAGESEAGISSPSKVFRDQIGIPIMQGIIVGLTSKENELINAMQYMIGGMLETTLELTENLSEDIAKIIQDVQSQAQSLATELNNIVKAALEAGKALGNVQIQLVNSFSDLFTISADTEIENAVKEMRGFGDQYTQIQRDIEKQRLDTEQLVQDSIKEETKLRQDAEYKIANIREKLSEELAKFADDETNPAVIEKRNKLKRDAEKEIADIALENAERIGDLQRKRDQATVDLAKAEKNAAFELDSLRGQELTKAREIERLRIAQQKQRAIADKAQADLLKAEQDAAVQAQTDPAKAARILDQRRSQIVEIAKLDQVIELAKAKFDDAEVARLEKIRAITIRNHKIDQDLLAMTNSEEDAKAAQQLQRLNEIAEKITAIFSTGYFADVGQNVAEGITAGIIDNIGSVSKALADGMNAALKNLKATLGIQSPSKVFANEIAKPSIEGWVGGLQKLGSMVGSTVGNIGMQSVAAVPSPALAGSSTVYNIHLDLSGSTLNRGEVESILDRKLDKIVMTAKALKRS